METRNCTGVATGRDLATRHDCATLVYRRRLYMPETYDTPAKSVNDRRNTATRPLVTNTLTSFSTSMCLVPRSWSAMNW